MAKLQLTRDVTMQECNWLSRDFKEFEIVYKYTGHVYGVISNDGVACCEIEGAGPFFELPADALSNVPDHPIPLSTGNLMSNPSTPGAVMIQKRKKRKAAKAKAFEKSIEEADTVTKLIFTRELDLNTFKIKFLNRVDQVVAEREFQLEAGCSWVFDVDEENGNED